MVQSSFDPDWVQTDPEWRAALHILDSPILAAKGVRAFVDFGERCIDFCTMAEAGGAWSSGEKALVYSAWGLFNCGAGGRDELGGIVRVLQGEHLQRVVEAMEMFVGGELI